MNGVLPGKAVRDDREPPSQWEGCSSTNEMSGVSLVTGIQAGGEAEVVSADPGDPLSTAGPRRRTRVIESDLRCWIHAITPSLGLRKPPAYGRNQRWLRMYPEHGVAVKTGRAGFLPWSHFFGAKP